MENIKDGTAEFRVTDDRLFSILDLIYPVGRIIISNDSTAPYSDIGFGTWQEVAKGAFIEGADDSHKAGDNIDAGLPDIVGYFNVNNGSLYYGKGYGEAFSGPFTEGAINTNVSGGTVNIGQQMTGLWFHASKANPIYGKSNTVQPKAYVSHYWLRVK